MICDILGTLLLGAACFVAGVKFAHDWRRLSDMSDMSDMSDRSDASDMGGGHGF